MGAVKKLYELMGVTTPRVELEFVTQATRLGSQGETIDINSTGSFFITDSNSEVFIDWGDGTSETINIPVNQNVGITGGATGRHSYEGEFVYPASKLVKIRFLNPLSVKRFEIVRWWVRGNLSTAIDLLQNLEYLSIEHTYLDSIPANIANLHQLKTLRLSANPSLEKKIPEYILDITSLEEFTSGQNMMGDLSYEDSRVDRLKDLPNLKGVNFSTNRFTEIPPPLFEIPNLISIGFQTQLPTISISPVIPIEATAAIKWKSISLSGCFRDISFTDQWIDNFYDFVTTNAAMAGLTTLPFRGMDFNNIGGLLPTGIYQQPVDYIQGANNGYPATAYEKLWVLVNQYACQFLINSLTPSEVIPGSTTQITLNRIFVAVTNKGVELEVGSVIRFTGIGGTIGAVLNDFNHTITNISDLTITISTDTSGLEYTSGGSLYRISL